VRSRTPCAAPASLPDTKDADVVARPCEGTISQRWFCQTVARYECLC
jgi:hypothetical protein